MGLSLLLVVVMSAEKGCRAEMMKKVEGGGRAEERLRRYYPAMDAAGEIYICFAVGDSI